MGKKIVLFSLQTFSTTGGIQKMTRTLAYALQTLATRKGWEFTLWSAYDKKDDVMPKYLPAGNFKGFMADRYNFIIKGIKLGRQSDVIIISHINMAIVGLLIKLIKPKCEVVLIAHGIEVWRPLSLIKQMFLRSLDKVMCVSAFTKADMIKRHGVRAEKCVVINNAIDPFMKLPVSFDKPVHLLQRYGLHADDNILFTLTRLSATEQYKGYDQVLKTLTQIKASYPGVKYLLSGKYDAAEKLRLDHLIAQYDVKDEVILTGFIDEEELAEHFLLADVFILPSKKEGFGIVFIEALACGLPVICGNADGSLDAILNGELGKAIDPDDPDALATATLDCLANRPNLNEKKRLQHECLQHFNADNYIAQLEKLFKDEQ